MTPTTTGTVTTRPPEWVTGPEVDGRQTWFCQRRHVPEGYVWRTGPHDEVWSPAVGAPMVDGGAWVQARLDGPLDSDQVEVVIDPADLLRVPVTFAEVATTLTDAAGEKFTTPVTEALARAVWQLLTTGKVPTDG